MGNTPSQEAPPSRPAARKLSKPRVTGRDRPRDRVAASAPSSQLAIHNIKQAQFSNSYLVGTLPIPVSSDQRTSVDVVSPGPAAAVFHDNVVADPAIIDSKTTVSDPRSPVSPTGLGPNDLLRAERIERRRSTGHGSVEGMAPPSRAPSRQSRHSMQPIARTPSVQTTNTRSGTRDGPSIPEEPLPRSQSLVERRASLHSRSNSRAGESQDAACNMRRNSTPAEPEMMPPNRTQSETSLYPPHRRRSLVLTPGVATRAESTKTLRRKASFRRSMEPPPLISRENSVDSKASRHMSLPVLPSRSDLTERAPTPSETEYKQLGGMAFGSLRITNGAPAPSPAQEPEEETLYAPQAEVPDITGYPDVPPIMPVEHRAVDGLHMKARKSRSFLLQPASPRSPKMKSSFRDTREEAQDYSPLSSLEPSHRVADVPHAPVTVRPPTPELETTSKHAAVDDHLFEDEESSPRPESAEPVAQVVQVARELDVGMKSPIRPSLVQVTRKDSGYVSNSSKSSRKGLSTIDSGYISNVSVRSIHQKRAMTDNSDYLSSANHSDESNGPTPSSEHSSTGTSPLRSDEMSTPSEEHLQPSVSSKDDASVSTPRTSTSSTAHSIIRLPSLRSGKSRDQKQLRKSPSQDRPKSPGNLLQRVASPTKASSPTGNGYSTPRMSGLRRLLSGKSNKGLATSYAVHEFDGVVPSVPNAVEKQLQGHSARFPTAPKRLALRVEASQDSLGTIMSVEDTSEPVVSEEATSPPPPPQQHAPEPPRQHEPTEQRRPERRHTNRLSTSSVSGSITGAATSLLSPKSSSGPRSVIRRRSTMDEQNIQRSSRGLSADSDSDEEVIVDGTVVDDRNFMLPSVRRSVGNSAFDQALMGLDRDQGRYPTPESQSWMKEPYVDPRGPRRHPQLRSRKSAPDVRQTIAGHLSPVFERDSVMTSKTPPPISMQTRGSKKKKRGGSKSNRRQSSPAGIPQHRQPAPYDPYDSASSAHSSVEDLGNYPYPTAPGQAPPMAMQMPGPYPRAAPLPSPGPHHSQQRNAPAPKMRRPMFGQRYSYDGHGQRPPPPMPQPQQSALAPMPSREQNPDHWMPNRRPKEGPNSAQDGSESSRPSSSRVSGDSGNAPFRVLHSYNSPAYKGIPIWG